MPGVTGKLAIGPGIGRSLGASMASQKLPANVGGTLQVRTKIDTGLSLTFTTKTGEKIEYPEGTVTMLDQTWMDDVLDIHGVATVFLFFRITRISFITH